MPLTPYRRGAVWWAKGRVEYNGRAITDYYRRSTGASSEPGARDWIRHEEARQIRRYLVGEEAEVFTFNDAVMLYTAKGNDAAYLLKIVPEIGTSPIAGITPQGVRALAPKLYPTASTDTWKRQVLSPVSAVINNAHDHGKCAPIRIKGYSAQERIDQDRRRGKQSRRPKRAGSWEWLDAFQAHADPYNAALAEFMFETGARISQAVDLVPGDRDLPRLRVWLGACKGHDAQWVAISAELAARLANLPPKQPKNRITGERLAPRVFGYADRSSPQGAWKRICKAAGIDYLTPHEAGRHGFYTELRVRQGLDPVTVARAGRWSDPTLPDRAYAHVDGDDRQMRDRIRTGRVQPVEKQSANSLRTVGKTET